MAVGKHYQLSIVDSKDIPVEFARLEHPISRNADGPMAPDDSDTRVFNKKLTGYCSNPSKLAPGYTNEATRLFIASFSHSTDGSRCLRCAMVWYLTKPTNIFTIIQMKYLEALKNDIQKVANKEIGIADIKEQLGNCLRIFRNYRGCPKSATYKKDVVILKSKIAIILDNVRNGNNVDERIYLEMIANLTGLIIFCKKKRAATRS